MKALFLEDNENTIKKIKKKTDKHICFFSEINTDFYNCIINKKINIIYINKSIIKPNKVFNLLDYFIFKKIKVKTVLYNENEITDSQNYNTLFLNTITFNSFEGDWFDLITNEKLNSNKKNNINIAAIKTLSKREIQILKFLLDGISNKNVCECLNIKPSMVSNYKKKIFYKLNVNSIIEIQNNYQIPI